MKIAAITPVYNDAKTLPAVLESMAAQTRKPDEIWLIDDASPDVATQTFLKGLGKTYKGIPLNVLFQAKNAGAGAARNRALAATKCEIVAFLDGDDAWAPTHLADSLEAMKATSATLVASNFIAVAMSGTETLWDCAKSAARRDFINRGNQRTHYFYRGFLGIFTVVCYRDPLVKAGGFNASKRYSLDWELWHAMLESNPGSFFHVIPKIGGRYTLNPLGLTSKTWPRLAERENYLPTFVRGVARAGGVPWPLLLLRGWLTIQYETFTPLRQRREWAKLLMLALRAPFALTRLLYMASKPQAPRPNFLQKPWMNE